MVNCTDFVSNVIKSDKNDNCKIYSHNIDFAIDNKRKEKDAIKQIKNKIIEKIKNNDSELIETIIKTIEERFNIKLPSIGYLAGGAVSNVILSMVTGKDYKINDVDIFITKNDFEKNIAIEEKDVKDFNVFIRKECPAKTVVVDYDGLSRLFIGFLPVYHIEKVIYYKDIINYVVISSINKDLIKDVYNNEFPKVLIDSFDINQTMVAIDLETKKIYTNEFFIDFINSFQLKLINADTPFSSFIRLLKKRDELNCYLDIDFEYNKIVHSFNSIDGKTIEKKSKTYKLYQEKYKSLVDKYFVVWSQKEELFGNVFEYLRYMPRKIVRFDEVNSSDIAYTMPKILERLKYGKKGIVETVFNILYGTKHLLSILISYPSFGDCVVKINDVMKAETFISNILIYPDGNISINDLKYLCVGLNIKLKDFLYLIELIQNNKNITLISDFVEEVIIKIKTKQIKTFEEVVEYIKNYDNINNFVISNVIEIEDFEYRNYVFQPKTRKDFKHFGDLLKNCLGNYWEKLCANKYLFILTSEENNFSKPENLAAVEYQYSNQNKMFMLSSLLGVENKNVDNLFLQKIAFELNFYLNKNIKTDLSH